MPHENSIRFISLKICKDVFSQMPRAYRYIKSGIKPYIFIMMKSMKPITRSQKNVILNKNMTKCTRSLSLKGKGIPRKKTLIDTPLPINILTNLKWEKNIIYSIGSLLLDTLARGVTKSIKELYKMFNLLSSSSIREEGKTQKVVMRKFLGVLGR